MIISRRGLLAATSSLICALAVVRCSAVPTTISEAATDAQQIATGLSDFLGVLKGLGVTIPADLTSDVTDARKYAGELADATADAGTSIAQQFAAAVKGVAAIALPLIPATASNASELTSLINAGVDLTTAVLSDFGIVSASAAAPEYTRAAARTILSDFHVRHGAQAS